MADIVDERGGSSIVVPVWICHRDLTFAEKQFLEDEGCVAGVRVDVNRIIIDRLLSRDNGNVIILVAIVRMIVDYRVVSPDVTLHTRVLQNEVLCMAAQEMISFILSLAPLRLAGFILTVDDRD